MSATAVEEDVKKSGADQDWTLCHKFHLCQPSVGPATAVCGSRIDLSGDSKKPWDMVCAMCVEVSAERHTKGLVCPLCQGKYPKR